MSGYKAIIAKIDAIEKILNADNIVVAKVLGESCIVSRGDYEVGDVGVLFPADTQLAYNYCKHNNLHRHTDLNIDPDHKAGFLEDNRRIKVLTLRKAKSEALFMPLSSLDYLSSPVNLKVGDTLNSIGGEEICCKYISPQRQRAEANRKKGQVKKKKIETPLFLKHVDTQQFRHYANLIPKGALLSFHAKVHGTSARYSLTKIVKEPRTWLEKLLNKFNLFNSESWDYVVGTRNVTRYEEDCDKEGFHGSEQFRYDVLETIKPYLEKGMTVYGEIAGYANGKPIMPSHGTKALDKALQSKKYSKKYGESMQYKYNCKDHEWRFHIYRITYVNESGKSLDFTDAQVLQWCKDRDLLGPVPICQPKIHDGDTASLTTVVEFLTERPDLLTEDYIDPSHISEGVILRVDNGGQTPQFFKSKSFAFKLLEGIIKEDVLDMEEEN